jgi:hypothetical protein
MDRTSFRNRVLRFAAIGGALALLVPSPGSAQQESSSRTATSPQANPDASMSGDRAGTDESSSKPGPTIPTSPSAPMRIGTARPLDLSGSLRFGPFFVSSAEFSQVLDEVRPSNGTGGSRNIATFLGTFITYQHLSRRGRLALQYEPHFSIINGHSDLNYNDQELNLDTQYAISSRWGVGLSDHFTYLSRNRFGSFLDADSVTGTTVQNAFADTRGRWLSNGLSGNFTYHWSARTQLNLEPNATYAQDNPEFASLKSVSSFSYGAGAGITHLLSARKSIEGYYSYQRSIFYTSLPSTTYNTVGAGYSQGLGSTWFLHAALGVSTATSRSASRQWYGVGSLGLVKAFPRSQLSFTFARGYGLSGFITNRYGDRADAAFVHRWTQRLQTKVGTGYQREIAASNGGYSGKYGTGQVSYRLLANVSWFASYVYKFQSGGTFQAFAGTRNFFSTGFRWEPARAAGF